MSMNVILSASIFAGTSNFRLYQSTCQGMDEDDSWQDEAESGWESFVGVSRDDPDWDMMEEIAADSLFERSERE